MRYPILMIDSGDTIIDERTELRDGHGNVVYTRAIPGAAQTLRTLRAQGYTILMVADGWKRSFENVYHLLGLYDCYDGFVYSEVIGAEKPDARMFEAAMRLLPEGTPRDKIVMVGNNLARDILGANRFGLISVQIDWTNRYPRVTDDPQARPDYIIHTPEQLLPLMEKLHAEMN